MNMPDNPKKRKLDKTRVSLRQPHEVRYWTRAFGVTTERLKEAVKAAGSSAIAVCDYLKDDRWACGTVAGLPEQPNEVPL